MEVRILPPELLNRPSLMSEDRFCSSECSNQKASGSQRALECGSRFTLHPLGDVAIDVHHEAGGRVAESFGDHAGMSTRLKQDRGSRVAQVVEPNAREAGRGSGRANGLVSRLSWPWIGVIVLTLYVTSPWITHLH